MIQKKRLIAGTIAVALTASMIGCTQPVKPEEKPAEQQEIEMPQKEVSAELLSYLPKNTNGSYLYSGEIEYGHSLKVEKTHEDKNQVNYELVGEIHTNSTVKSPEDSFKISLSVDSENMYMSSDYSYTLLKDYTVLQLPLGLNTEWSEAVTIDGKSYEAKSKIIEIDDSDDDKSITVKTIIENIEGYTDNTYTQIITFKESLGIKRLEYDYLYKDYTDSYKLVKQSYEFFGYQKED